MHRESGGFPAYANAVKKDGQLQVYVYIEWNQSFWIAMLVRTEGIVLRSVPYKETSRLATLYTRTLGKLTLIAHGAQSIKSHFGATLQLLSHVQAVIYTRPTRSIQILSDCSHVRVYNRITGDLTKVAIGQRICEFVLSLTEEGQNSPEIFDLLVRVMNALDSLDVDAVLLKLYFQTQLMELLGFAPAFSRESVEEIDNSGGYLLLENGTITSQAIDDLPTLFASRSVLRAFAILHRADFDIILHLKLTAAQRKELHTLVTTFMRYHVPDTYPVRGQKVIDQLLGS